ncbi:MAG: 1-acyl-sn-glycerol-3-phosphate acyltransferase [Armatimonadetes bacterium]|nr:1-acyl-sn-glycerol-3-phosphate acyltransferase [Armatimonadota bacterium]
MKPPSLKPPFIPPRETLWVIWLGERFLPLVLRRLSQTVKVTVYPEEWARLERLRDQRLILSGNHPGGCDPLVAFWMARRLGRRFNYLAARDVFVGFKRWLLPAAGCYSIMRGVPDREAIRTTRRLLAEQDRQVVIFPEGEVYQLNDITLPFQAGVVAMGFWALEDLQRLGKPLSLPIVPMAIKYRCLCHAERHIRAALGRLEAALSLSGDPLPTLYGRLRRIGERVVAAAEAEVGWKPPEGASLGERIIALKEHLLQRVAETLRLPPFPGKTYAERLRAGFNAVHAFVSEYEDAKTDYERRLHQRRLELAEPLHDELWRLYQFVAVSDDYVARHLTCERFLEVINRLEFEILGKSRTSVPREAIVRIGEPMELAEQFDAYRQDRRATVNRLTAALEARVVGLLRELMRQGTPLSVPDVASAG